MKDFLVNSSYFGVLVSLLGYWAGTKLKARFRLAILNPLLVSAALTGAALLVLDIDYQSYNAGAKYLSYLLTPTTVCLAIPLYEQRALLKKNFRAIFAGILSGALTSVACVYLMSLAFGLDHAQYVTLLPKSVTTAIGMPVAQELGGYGNIAAAVIILTGVLGNIVAGGFFRLLRIREPIARGVALGTSSHAVGTARAMEMGDTEGAMSSLSIAVSGLVTVALVSVFSQFI